MPRFNIKDQICYENPELHKKEARDQYLNVLDGFRNRGMMIDSKTGDYTKFELNDLVVREDLMRFMPQVVETVVREAIEPNLFVVDRLFQKINIERGTRVQIGALGAMEAGRVGQAGEYPERTLDLDGGDMIAITTDKYGIKLSLTEEALQENQFDVVAVWLRAAGRALARCKERNGAKIINEMGYKVMDNVTPGESYLGVTTGRDITGTANGSVTVNDVFETYAYLLNRGFNPDVMMIHPMAWKTFMTDEEMREIVLAQSTITGIRQPTAGSYSEAWGTSHSGFGLRTTATGAEKTSGNTAKGGSAWTQTLNPLGSSFQIAPSYLPSPLEVLVTVYTPFAYGAQGIERLDTGCLSNVIMVDSMNCGVMGQSEEVRTDRWSDPERDIENIKLREQYGFAILEQGKGIAKISNIAIARNYNFDNVNSQTLAEINLSGNLSLGGDLEP